MKIFVDFINHLTPTMIIIAGLGVWRITSLVTNEGGPWGTFEKFREWCKWLCCKYKWCKEFHLDELVTCEWCCSVWIAGFTVLAWLFIGDAILVLYFILTLSAITIFIKFVVQNMDTALQIKALRLKKLSGKS